MGKKSSKQLIKETKERLKIHRNEHNERVTKNLDEFVFWTSLAILALFNLVGCVFLIPLFIFLEGPFLIGCVAAFGLLFGMLFNLLVLGLEHFEHRHNIIAGIFIPLLAVIDIALILKIVSGLSDTIVISPYNTGKIILIYLGVFMLPYFVSVFTGNHKV